MPQTFHASREQLGDAEDARGSATRVSLGASLLLHLGIIGLVFFRQPDTKLPEIPPTKVAMEVSITSTNPQLKPPSPPADAETNTETPVPEIAADQQVERTEPVAETTAAEQTASIDQPTLATSPEAAPASVSAPASESAVDQAVANPGTPGISASEVSNSVTAYIANYKSSLTSDWLSACLRYQNEHGVKTCPSGEDSKSYTTKAVNATTSQLFRVYVSGAAENARASEKLLKEMEAMRPFMKENSAMGELARQRYQLAEGSYCNFNSCRGATISTGGSFTSPFATPVSNEGSIKIMGFGSDAGGPSVVGGMMSLVMKPKPGAVKPFVPYRFTASPEQQAESEDNFKVEAPVFPIHE